MKIFIDYIYSKLLAKVRRLGINKEMRRFNLIGYLLGGLGMTYSVFNLFYDLNIEWREVIKLPFLDFYQQKIIPFITAPIKWVGLKITTLYKTLVVFSAIGASVWASVEFRTKTYLILFFFPKYQPKPGSMNFDMSNLDEEAQKIVSQKPPGLLSRRSLARIIHIPLLTYTLLGLLATLVGIYLGVKKFTTYLTDIILYTKAAYCFQRYNDIGGLTGKGKDNLRDPETYYTRYKNLDGRIEARLSKRELISATQGGTILPLINRIGNGIARVVALALFLIIAICLVTIFKILIL